MDHGNRSRGIFIECSDTFIPGRKILINIKLEEKEMKKIHSARALAGDKK